MATKNIQNTMQLKEEKDKLLRSMATVIEAAGYNGIAEDVRRGYRVSESISFFLRLFKNSTYGLIYTKTDASKIRKINNQRRKLYDETEKKILSALKLWKKR